MMVAISLSCGRDDIQPATATARPLLLLLRSSDWLLGRVEIKSKTGQWVLISSGGDDVASKEEEAEEEEVAEEVE